MWWFFLSGSDKSGQRQQKTQSSKDRKRKTDTNNTASVSEPTNSRKKTRSEDLNSNKVKPQPSRGETDLAQVSDAETTPPVRVSPRTTPSKERTRLQRSRERDKDNANSVVTSVHSGLSTESVSNVDKASSDNKSKFRSRQKKEEKLDSPSRKTDSPRNWADSPRGSPRRRSLSRTPVQSEAESVIKSNSGSKKDKKVTEKGDKKVSSSAKSETSETNTDPEKISKPKVSDIQSSVKSVSSNLNTDKAKGKGKDDKSSRENSDIVEQKVQEIKSALKKREKESGSSRSGEGKDKKTPKPCAAKKETTGKRKDKKSENETAQEVSCAKEGVDAKKASCTDDIINESGDNMHYIKKKQSILAVGASSGTPQNNIAPTSNIDLNQSLTDQIARGEKLTSVNGDNKVSPSSQSSLIESYPQRDTDCLVSSKDIKPQGSSNSGDLRHINSSSSLPEERSQSRNSDSRCSSAFSGDEAKRPGSRLDDLKSVKNSPASSPLIVDKSEPVQIYRDPELMSKNPVRSNVPNMHNSHKSYPTVHNPIPTQASRPASVGMPSTPLTSGLDRSSRTPVLPSVAYPSPLQLGPSAIPGASLSSLLPPGLHQLDPATLAIHQQIQAVQQQQQMAALAQQYSSALSMSYPPRGTLSKAQLEHLWQQKYPTVPVPPPWMLTKHDDVVGGVRMLHEQEQLERERIERIEREREREQRDRKDRERRERDRIEKERLDR